MESTVRGAARASTMLRSSASRRAAMGAGRIFQQQSRRTFANSTTTNSSRMSPNTIMFGGFALLAGGTGFYTFRHSRPTFAESPEASKQQESARQGNVAEARKRQDTIFTPNQQDYQDVYNTIASKIIEDSDYDLGSYAPILLRLGWHSSGSYDAATNTGGSNGATMRFPPEGELPANSGLRHARDFLEPIKAQYPWISYSDLWTLAAVCAVQEMAGPVIPWRPGREDKDIAFCSPDGRLPDGSQEQNHVRKIFGRMGFSDQEMVALSGAHAVGRCHVERSGFDGPWTFSPITFTNDFYRLLLDEEWHERDWKGPRQFQDDSSKSLMMLPTDYSLVQDKEFHGWVERYAGDEEVFFGDFSKALVKLFELGVPFEEGSERMEFERME